MTMTRKTDGCVWCTVGVCEDLSSLQSEHKEAVETVSHVTRCCDSRSVSRPESLSHVKRV